MSNLEAVTKIADQIIKRVFDQRQFTSGEISYLGKRLEQELELERNFDRILKINENACMISDLSTDEMCLSHDAKREEICDQVSSLLDRTKRILQLESDYCNEYEKRLGDLRRELEQKKRECISECTARMEKLKESMMEEEVDLERKYLKFEENLRNK